MTATKSTATPRPMRDGEYAARPAWMRSGSMVTCSPPSMVASAIPVQPPREWFNNPQLPALTGLTVEDNGRVSGHIASWRQDHIGLAGSVRAPRNRSGYAFFKSGVIHCDDGSQVDVGQITLTGGHAPLTATAQDAVKHYDDTKSAVMDVTVGEDRHGIWVAGALRPEVTPAQIRSLRACGVSGDWRPINGKQELVAICSVPVPGFPIPRTLVASGELVALVAAGTPELVELALRRGVDDEINKGITAAMAVTDERLSRLERVTIKIAAQRRHDNDAVVASAAGDAARCEELRQRVHKPVTASADPDPRAQLRSRVHGDQAKETS